MSVDVDWQHRVADYLKETGPFSIDKPILGHNTLGVTAIDPIKWDTVETEAGTRLANIDFRASTEWDWIASRWLPATYHATWGGSINHGRMFSDFGHWYDVITRYCNAGTEGFQTMGAETNEANHRQPIRSEDMVNSDDRTELAVRYARETRDNLWISLLGGARAYTQGQFRDSFQEQYKE